MIIQHNIMALNSHRQLGINNTNLSKNLEKLSSGYRINKAADDAAGLAISEKMRAQITGLNRAVLNAQDGASLIQTAEGALQEVHGMLNRMVELATQSANGTIQIDDRKKIESELQALKDEIDRISEATNFNGIPLLDGSMAGEPASGTVTMGDFAEDLELADGVTMSNLNGVAEEMAFALGEDGITAAYDEAKNTFSVSYTDANGKEVVLSADTTALKALFDESETGTVNLKFAREGNTATSMDIDITVAAGTGDMETAMTALKEAFEQITVAAPATAKTGGTSPVKPQALAAEGTPADLGDFALEAGAPVEGPASADMGDLELGTQLASNLADILGAGASSADAISFADVNGDLEALLAGLGGVDDPTFSYDSGDSKFTVTIDGTTYEASTAGLDVTGGAGALALEFSSDSGVTTAFTIELTLAADETGGDSGAAMFGAVATALSGLEVTEEAAPLSVAADTSITGIDGLDAVLEAAGDGATAAMSTDGGDLVLTVTAKDGTETKYVASGGVAALAADGPLSFEEVDGTGTPVVGGGTFDITIDVDGTAADDTEFNAAMNTLLDEVQVTATSTPTTIPANIGDGSAFKLSGVDGLEEVLNAEGIDPEAKMEVSLLDDDVTMQIKIGDRYFQADTSAAGADGVLSFTETDADGNAIPGSTDSITLTITDGADAPIDFTDPAVDAAALADLADGLNTLAADVAPAQPGDPVVDPDPEPADPEKPAGNGLGLTLQVGDTDNSYDKITVYIDDMSTQGLGIDNIHMTDQESAAAALGTIKAAIEKVSVNRGNLGALQNRLEHTINNLNVTSENMTAAESRIRDVDMAKEMMQFTKNNVLSQAAQAMLAQANQQPQQVLQLLR